MAKDTFKKVYKDLVHNNSIKSVNSIFDTNTIKLLKELGTLDELGVLTHYERQKRKKELSAIQRKAAYKAWKTKKLPENIEKTRQIIVDKNKKGWITKLNEKNRAKTHEIFSKSITKGWETRKSNGYKSKQDKKKRRVIYERTIEVDEFRIKFKIFRSKSPRGTNCLRVGATLINYPEWAEVERKKWERKKEKK